MFLDDQLYEWVKLRDIEKPEDFQTLVTELYGICEDYYKKRMKENPFIGYTDCKRLMDRVFQLWDLFIVKLEKENWYLIDVLKKYSFKKSFMNNPGLKEIYDKGAENYQTYKNKR
jgi:hypothetical protein